MKVFRTLTLAIAATALFAACSSDKDVLPAGGGNAYNMVEGQSSWLAIGLAMPGDAASTRANEDLTDGVTAEYEVKSGRLVLFKGSNENDATLIGNYDITPEITFDPEAGDNVPGGNSLGTDPDGFGEITSTSKKVVKEITNPSLGTGEQLYAYVILNDKDNLTDINYTVGQPFSDFKVQVLHAIGIGTEAAGYGNIGSNGLVMTNVPIADNPGGDTAPAAGTKVTTLAVVDGSALYNSAEAAAAGTSVACIYVERAAVKIEVKSTASKIKAGSEDLDFDFNGWALGNVNNGGSAGSGYYNTRQFDETWLPYANEQNDIAYTKYRMVGRTSFFTSGHTLGYRTYFGRDVNYNSNTGLINGQLTDAQHTLANNGITYTYENTFDENSQIFANTTYVGIKTTISGGTFYTIEDQPNTRLTSTDIPTALASTTTMAADIYSKIAALSATIDANLALPTTDPARLSAGITKVSFKIAPEVTPGTKDAATGEVPYTYTLKVSDLKDQTDTPLSGTDLVKVNAMYSFTPTTGTIKLYEYTGGVTYYAQRIAHFGNVETPWSAPGEAYNDYDKIYPTDGQSIHATPINYGASRAAAWLGRWGIVRNNWYVIEITAINGLGSPVPVDYSGTGSGKPGSTPDDNPDETYFIAAHIHILPWVKRTQNLTLK